MRSRFLTSALFVLLTTYSMAAETPREVIVPGFSCHSGKYAVKLPKSLKKLRNIAKLEAEKSPRKEVGWEQYRELSFQGLEIGITMDATSDQYALENVEITGSQWNIAGPLRIGATAKDVFETLRKEWSTNGILKLWGPGPEAILVTIKNGLISQVSYSCYTG